MPPYNTPYHVIKYYRGAEFLRGWVQVDRQVYPRGHRIRNRDLERYQKTRGRALIKG